MKKSSGIDGSMDAELNSLLIVWAQSNVLPELRADAIQHAAKSAVPKVPTGRIKGASVPYVGLQPAWWFGFAQNLTGALTQASRSWAYSASR